MIHKAQIDLSQPHLIPERIRQYAFESFDTAQKYPTADAKVQRLHLMLRIAERILSNNALDPEGYFRETLAHEDHKNGLIALTKGENNWWQKRRKGNGSLGMNGLKVNLIKMPSIVGTEHCRQMEDVFILPDARQTGGIKQSVKYM